MFNKRGCGVVGKTDEKKRREGSIRKSGKSERKEKEKRVDK
jgi:hypothetical protein